MNVYYIEDDVFQQLKFKKEAGGKQLTNWAKIILPESKNLIYFWEELKETVIYDTDIFIIDIDLKLHYTGIDFANVIRSKNKLCYIIFLTNDRNKGLEVINSSIYPHKYFIKSQLNETYSDLLNEITNIKYLTQKTEGVIKFKIGSQLNLIPLKEINYIQSVKGYKSTSSIHLIKGQQIIAKKLNFFKELVAPHHFYNNFRSFSINIYNIKKMAASKEYIEFYNGDDLYFNSRSIKKMEHFIYEYI